MCNIPCVVCIIWSSDAVTARQSICVWALFFCWLVVRYTQIPIIYMYVVVYLSYQKPRWGLMVRRLYYRVCGLAVACAQYSKRIIIYTYSCGVSFISFVCFARRILKAKETLENASKQKYIYFVHDKFYFMRNSIVSE